MYCQKCGTQNTSGQAFCQNCGASLTNTTVAQPIYQNNYAPIGGVVGPDPRYDYTPLGAWAYFGYNLLFSIPLVGFILLIVFSFGGTKKINLRNYARSFFCVMALSVIILIILAALGVFRYLPYYLYF